MISYFFFFNDTATTEIYTLSLHDALPIYIVDAEVVGEHVVVGVAGHDDRLVHVHHAVAAGGGVAESIVAEYEVARVEDRLRRRACAELERRERHVGLEGRPRRGKFGEAAGVWRA